MKIYINGVEISADTKAELNRRIAENRCDHQQIFTDINRPLPLSPASKIAAKLLSLMR